MRAQANLRLAAVKVHCPTTFAQLAIGGDQRACKPHSRAPPSVTTNSRRVMCIAMRPSYRGSCPCQPVRTERRVPLDWVEGVERLQYRRPITGIPQHRWRQFVDDSNRFISSIQAERAAQLGWDARALFGCRRDRPGAADIGLLWAVNGGRVLEIHRDWASIELAANGSQRIFDRRRPVAANVTLPWIEPDRRPSEHR
jgi:hypothetical protein